MRAVCAPDPPAGRAPPLSAFVGQCCIACMLVSLFFIRRRFFHHNEECRASEHVNMKQDALYTLSPPAQQTRDRGRHWGLRERAITRRRTSSSLPPSRFYTKPEREREIITISMHAHTPHIQRRRRAATRANGMDIIIEGDGGQPTGRGTGASHCALCALRGATGCGRPAGRATPSRRETRWPQNPRRRRARQCPGAPCPRGARARHRRRSRRG